MMRCFCRTVAACARADLEPSFGMALSSCRTCLTCTALCVPNDPTLNVTAHALPQELKMMTPGCWVFAVANTGNMCAKWPLMRTFELSQTICTATNTTTHTHQPQSNVTQQVLCKVSSVAHLVHNRDVLILLLQPWYSCCRGYRSLSGACQCNIFNECRHVISLGGYRRADSTLIRSRCSGPGLLASIIVLARISCS